MRAHNEHQENMFSYISSETRVPLDNPLRRVRAMTDQVLQTLSPWFSELYSLQGRPSIAPEKLLRALLLQALYNIRSERLLMEQLNNNLLFRWFVGLNIDEPVWDVTVFTKKRAVQRTESRK
jgi:transposase